MEDVEENIIEEVEEIIRSDQAVFISIMVMIATGGILYLYKRQVERASKKGSLNIRYQFKFPQEKILYEKKMLEEPDPDDFKSTQEFEKCRVNWYKELNALLMKRAIMTIALTAKVNQDYKSYQNIYKSGINLDIWKSVEEAKNLVEKEIKIIQEEAEWIKPGWGKLVFQQANQLRTHMIMQQHEKMKKAKAQAENKN